MTGRTDHLLTGGENTRLGGGKPGTAAVSGLYFCSEESTSSIGTSLNRCPPRLWGIKATKTGGVSIRRSIY